MYSIAAVLTGLAQVFRDLGTGQLLVARRELSTQEQRALLSIALTMGWSLALLLSVLAQPLAEGILVLPALQLLAVDLALPLLARAGRGDHDGPGPRRGRGGLHRLGLVLRQCERRRGKSEKGKQELA